MTRLQAVILGVPEPSNTYLLIAGLLGIGLLWALGRLRK